ncbi:R3H and G-patch domain protein, putative [Trichophyton verrucosum HKI 0517]|uniref:Protein SQS1 n=1 Tax=Trichophyton verrucosum (strain HKI 0517) TaxID=663202 RepID=D4DEF6_TRIVH|nr:R3H and G-patch domain protein, putative [Trichophyton verrucosum HKI 0517]EFE39787.1 R3H and G-patch domain protein, putative [Trichophyton verrucosum HKI 0517]
MADTVEEHYQFTLSQEALNTERHSFERSSRQLRYQTVQFVSGGQKEPNDPAVLRNLDNLVLDRDTTKEDNKEDTRGEDVEVEAVVEVEQVEADKQENKKPEKENQKAGKEEREEKENQKPESREKEEEDLYVIDTEGDKTVKPTLPNPVINCDSSDSSADEVVFTGRVPLWRRQVRSRVVNDPPPAASSTAQRTPPKRSHDAVDRRDTGFRGWSGTSRRRMSPRRVVLEFGNDSADSDAVADYLANLIGDDSSDSSDGWSDDEQPGKAVTPKTPGMSGPDDVDEEEEGSSSGDDDDDDDDEDDEDIDIDSDMQWMSDEQLAHLLDTGDIPDMDADEIDFFTTHGFARSGAAAASGRNKKNKKKDKRKNASLREPISASKLADMFEEDPYGAFDIMDYNRTSLMGKKARGKMPDFDLSDSELESNIHASWENDRRKKKAKKLEREELRAQGLLGKSGKARPRGNTPDDIRDEIRSFMMSRTQTLQLPPMAKKDRKLVHEMANALSLKSISRGKGYDRFPILTKTRGTPTFHPDEVHELEALFSRRKITRYSDRRRAGPSGGARSGRARGETRAASYMDGDVVGASAPEIGADNRGRAMLEKMGWNTGMSLGAADNKGILQPVIHIVKTSKAGLG